VEHGGQCFFTNAEDDWPLAGELFHQEAHGEVDAQRADLVTAYVVNDEGGGVVGYIYNVIPDSHPDPSGMTCWLTARGFAAGPGDLRRRVSARSV
jgi:hypothetical protein